MQKTICEIMLAKGINTEQALTELQKLIKNAGLNIVDITLAWHNEMIPINAGRIVGGNGQQTMTIVHYVSACIKHVVEVNDATLADLKTIPHEITTPVNDFIEQFNASDKRE